MKELKVGDKIKVEHSMGRYFIEIERITKTMAISKPINNANATIRLKRYYNTNIEAIARGKWNTTTYTLINKS